MTFRQLARKIEEMSKTQKDSDVMIAIETKPFDVEFFKAKNFVADWQANREDHYYSMFADQADGVLDDDAPFLTVVTQE
jgi:hypothetical protein